MIRLETGGGRMNIAIVGSGPMSHIPQLKKYASQIDYWIGSDKGALYIAQHGFINNQAIGDFDSVTKEEMEVIKSASHEVHTYPADKNETDLELAIDMALKQPVTKIFFFGVSGARLDHGLINIQLLYPLYERGIDAAVIDCWNELSLKGPGEHRVANHASFSYVSFIPFTKHVCGLSLEKGFRYLLTDERIKWGSTLCISNELVDTYGLYRFTEGILLEIKSRDGQ